MNDLQLDAAIRAVTEEQEEARDRHPTPDDLLGYHLGVLESTERDGVEEHLALCPVCAQVILDFAAFPELGEVDVPPLLAEPRSGRSAPDLSRPGRPAGRARRLPLWSYPLAASLLLGTFSLGRWSQTHLPSAARPRAGGYFADLAPTENGKRGEPVTVTIPSWADRLWLLLELGTADQHPRYEALLEREGRRLWQDTVERNANGIFAVEVPREFLSDGRYRIRLSGKTEGGMESLATYDFRIAH
jgi:hypothetical protein